MLDHLVVGGGISGLVAAWRLRQHDPNARILVVEQAATLGGVLAGFDYPDQGLYFDQGTHIFRECGRPDIDNCLLAAADTADLIHFPPAEGDLAGSVFDGRLQAHSHFPDIRNRIDAAELRSAIEDHIEQATEDSKTSSERLEPALSVCERRFGSLDRKSVV